MALLLPSRRLCSKDCHGWLQWRKLFVQLLKGTAIPVPPCAQSAARGVSRSSSGTNDDRLARGQLRSFIGLGGGELDSVLRIIEALKAGVVARKAGEALLERGLPADGSSC